MDGLSVAAKTSLPSSTINWKEVPSQVKDKANRGWKVIKTNVGKVINVPNYALSNRLLGIATKIVILFDGVTKSTNAEIVKPLGLFSVGLLALSYMEAKKQWASAEKTWEYGLAFLASLGCISGTLGLPNTLISTAILIKPALETSLTAAKAAMPWLGVAALVLSTASLVSDSFKFWKSQNFEKGMTRKCNEAIIRHLRDEYPPSPEIQELLRQASVGLMQADVMKDLKASKTEIKRFKNDVKALKKDFKRFKKEIQKDNPDVKFMSGFVERAKEKNFLSEKAIQATSAAIKNLEDGDYGDFETWAQVAVDPQLLETLNQSTRVQLSNLNKQISKARKERDAVPVKKLVEEMVLELSRLDPKSQEMIHRVSNAAYLDALIGLKDKSISRNYKVSGPALREVVKRTKDVYAEKSLKGDPKSDLEIDKMVSLLKGRFKANQGSAIFGMTTSSIAVIAAVLLTLAGFGLSATPLAPIGLSILVCIGVIGLVKNFYDEKQTRIFESKVGITENKLAAKWKEKLSLMTSDIDIKYFGVEGEERHDADEKLELIENLQQNIKNRRFEKEYSKLSIAKTDSKEEKKFKKSYNKVVEEFNHWRKKHYLNQAMSNAGLASYEEMAKDRKSVDLTRKNLPRKAYDYDSGSVSFGSSSLEIVSASVGA